MSFASFGGLAVATLLDTSALVVLLRRSPPAGRLAVAEAAAAELRSSRGLISAVTVTELLVGARDSAAETRLLEFLTRLPVVASGREIADAAGRMGRQARNLGAILPLPDLLIAATARWLDVPLLTCDADFARGQRLAERSGSNNAWRGFRLHPSSVIA